MDRKKKLRVYQIFFLVIGLSIIIITYAQYDGAQKDTIFSKVEKNKIDKKLQMQNPDNKNIFYNVKYSGLDLEGNQVLLLFVGTTLHLLFTFYVYFFWK